MRGHQPGRVVSVIVFFVAVLAGGAAFAKHVRFAGPHPVAARYGGGYCYIEAPHVHIYGPETASLYAETPDGFVFTGDPTPFGWDGPKFAFYGHHPVPGVPGAVCYIEGPHYHPYEPPRAPEYRVEKGVAFYVGAFPDVYYRERPHRAKVVAAVYAPYAAMRPVVEVAPPPEWHGEVWVAPPAPPTVVVGAPPVPGVFVAPPRAPGVYVAPPRPPSIFIGAPAPPSVYLGAPRPGVVVVHEHDDDEHGGWRRDDDDDRGGWHRDNGRHKGWYKHHGR